MVGAMTQLGRVLSLLTMFNQRQSISLKTIRETLGISERTAYRYVAELSSANIPLYYDDKSGGYRLDQAADIALPTLTDNEMIVLTTAIMIARRHLNSSYRTTLDQLALKLCVRQRLPLDRIIETYRETSPKSVAQPDYSPEVTATLFEFAVAQNRDIQVVKSESHRMPRTLSVRYSSMTFHKSWHLTGTGADRDNVDFRSIAGVTVSSKSPEHV
jgi:HTH domain